MFDVITYKSYGTYVQKYTVQNLQDTYFTEIISALMLMCTNKPKLSTFGTAYLQSKSQYVT